MSIPKLEFKKSTNTGSCKQLRRSDLEELVAVGEVVVGHVDVAALLVVVAAVVVAAGDGRPLLGVGSHKVDVRVRVDFRLLERRELRAVEPQRLVRGQRAAHLPVLAAVAVSMRARRLAGAFAGLGAAASKCHRSRIISE